MNKPIFLALAAAFLLCVPRAGAHAFLDHATPAVGAKIRAAPAEVKLWFTEKLEAAFSSAQVFDAAGTRIDLGAKPGVDAAVLTVALPKLKPGAYKVCWKAVSVDTHRTKGEFTFTLAPP